MPDPLSADPTGEIGPSQGVGPSAGAGDPPAIVLVHGFTGSAESWSEDLVGPLGREGARVARVQVPGHAPGDAGAEPPECTLGAAMDVILAASDRPVHLVGYSMGGRIALHFAVRHPERVLSLVLESSSPGLPTAEERSARRASDEELALRLEAGGIEDFVAAWETKPIFAAAAGRAPDVSARERSVRLSHRPSHLAAALRGLGTGALPSLWDRLAEVRAPTTLIVGAQDRKFVDIADRMVAALPRARVTAVPGAGHTVHLDRPEAWLAAVRIHLAWAGPPSSTDHAS